MSEATIMAVVVLAASAAGTLVGCVVAAGAAARIVRARLPEATEFIAVENIHLVCDVTSEGVASVERMRMSTSAAEYNATMIERWLDKRGLVAMPKGPEFKAKAVKLEGGAA